jgi:hypothetical protein
MITTILALATVFTFAAHGDDNNSVTKEGVTITLEKKVYSAGETIVVETAGVTKEMETADAFVVMYKKGAPYIQRITYENVKAGENRTQFKAPADKGDYEFRFFRQGRLNANDLVASLPFVVGDVEVARKAPARDAVAPAGDNRLTFAAIKKTAEATLFDMDDDFDFEGSQKPANGFTIFYPKAVFSDIVFMEFASEQEAQAYKAKNDKPKSMFPVDHLVQGRFAAKLMRDSSGGKAGEAFIENIYKTAAAGKGAPVGELTYDALWKAVRLAGYEAEGSYGSAGEIRPDYGFSFVYTNGGDFKISVMEFDSTEKAQAYKTANDKGRAVCVAQDRFAAHIFDGLRQQDVADIRAFLEDLFKAAKDGSVLTVVRREAAKEASNPLAFMTHDELAKILTNFKIAVTLDAAGQNPYHFIQTLCAEGMLSETKGDQTSLTFVDFKSRRGYMLDAKNKTGKVQAMPAEMSLDRFMGFGFMLASHLYMHEDRIEDLEKTGVETLLGRPTTVYKYDYGAMVNNGDATMTFWIDDEYGFALKTKQSGIAEFTTTVTEFKVGGVTLKDMVNLNEYKIEAANDDDE